MANRTFRQFFYTPHMMPVMLDCNWEIGATGAVTADSVKGPGISSVTRLAAGIYKIQLEDNYNRFYGAWANIQAPVTGAGVALGSITPGLVYQISSLGNSTTANWVTAGVPTGITPALGVVFKAAATSSGTGEAKLLGVSGVSAVEILGDTDDQLAPVGAGSAGGYVVIKCLGATDASTTTLIAKDPAEGSKMYVNIYLSNSSVMVQGE